MKIKNFDFRVWDYENNKFINNDDLTQTNVEIELYTGYKDKNNIKIFDGDILKILLLEKNDCSSYINGLVTFEDFSFKIKVNCDYDFKKQKEYQIFYFKTLIDNSSYFEVIGNIHDNKMNH